MYHFDHIRAFYLARFEEARGTADGARVQQAYTDYFWLSA